MSTTENTTHTVYTAWAISEDNTIGVESGITISRSFVDASGRKVFDKFTTEIPWEATMFDPEIADQVLEAGGFIREGAWNLAGFDQRSAQVRPLPVEL